MLGAPGAMELSYDKKLASQFLDVKITHKEADPGRGFGFPGKTNFYVTGNSVGEATLFICPSR